MDSNAPNPPKRFWKLPLYLGRTALFLAFVPLAMIILCVVTQNTINSLIDLYYCFVTPLQICKWSLIATLTLSFTAIILAGWGYRVNGHSYRDVFFAALRLFLFSMFLIILQIGAVVFFSVLIELASEYMR